MNLCVYVRVCVYVCLCTCIYIYVYIFNTGSVFRLLDLCRLASKGLCDSVLKSLGGLEGGVRAEQPLMTWFFGTGAQNSILELSGLARSCNFCACDFVDALWNAVRQNQRAKMNHIRSEQSESTGGRVSQVLMLLDIDCADFLVP